MSYELFPLLLVFARLGVFVYEFAAAPFNANEQANWQLFLCTATITILLAIAGFSRMF